MGTTMKALQSVTIGAGGADSISFTNIPQTYTDLVIKMSYRRSSAGVGGPTVIYFNDDANYSYANTRLLGTGSAASSTNYGGNLPIVVLGEGNANGATANTFSNADIFISNYTSATTGKDVTTDMVGENNATEAYSTLFSSHWQKLEPITKIKIESGNAPVNNLMQYSTFTLYGIFNEDVSTAPSTPTIGTATLGNLSASVEFTPVSGAASYTITSTPGNITATGKESPIRIGGLTAGTAYTFTVKANNPIGTSAASAASNSVTPTSPGVTWTNRTGVMPAASGWNGVLYSAGVYIAGIYDVLNSVVISNNGITWTSRSLNTTGSGYYTGQAYGNGMWFVSSRNGAGTGYGIQYSTNNGRTWNYPSGSVANLDMYGIAFNGSAFCVTGNAGTTAQYSTTGTSGWTTSTLPSNQGWIRPVGGNGHFVAIQDGGSGPTNAAATSSNNGATWTARTMTGTAQRWKDGIYEPVSGKWVFVSRSGGACYSTDNGASYTASTLPTGVYNFITYGGGFYIASGWQNICTSPDGITWTLRTGPSGTGGGGEGITYGPDGAIVVQYGSTNMGTAF
jgi:hypothetical protein